MPNRREAAIRICKTLTDAGHRALLAGGCVRDLILGVPPRDYDVATSATPAVVARLFDRCIDVGAAFGVQLVVLPEGMFEVTTFRKDGPYADGRHPDYVEFADEVLDAQRRDFTINAMFYDPATDAILDYVGGQDDLRARRIRAVGDPEKRFAEDHLRLLRGVRFAARLDYTIVPETFEAIRRLAPLITDTSPERIRDEIVKILTETTSVADKGLQPLVCPVDGGTPKLGLGVADTGGTPKLALGVADTGGTPKLGLGVADTGGTPKLALGVARRGLELLDKTNLLQHVLPEVARMKGVEQPPEFHPEGDVLEHTLIMLEHLDQPSPALAMAVLLHDVGKPLTQTFEDRIRFNNHCKVGARLAQQICRRLHFPNEITDRVAWMVEQHMRVDAIPSMRESKRKRFIRHDAFPELLELCRLDCVASHNQLDTIAWIQRYIASLPPDQLKPAPLLTGDDLIHMGYTPGPLFTQILQTLEDEQLEGTLTTPDQARAFVRNHWQDPGSDYGIG